MGLLLRLSVAAALFFAGCSNGRTVSDSGRPDVPTFDSGLDTAVPIDAGGTASTCEACTNDAQCGTEAACIPLSSGEGSACFLRCNPDLPDCPADFSCVMDFSSGADTPICIPIGGACCVDADRDGFGNGVGCEDVLDCDDSSASTNPGVSETCNGVDDNCNGVVDEGVDDCLPVDSGVVDSGVVDSSMDTGVVVGGCPGAGALCPTGDMTLCGAQAFDGLYIPAGVTVACAPGCAEPLIFTITGTALIEGTIDVSGGRGGDAMFGGAGTGGTAGAAGCGGYAGGRGGDQRMSGTRGAGPGGGGPGGPLSDREFVNGGSGAGGGHGTAGQRGFSDRFTGTAGAGGTTHGDAMLTTLAGGSGGGGGSGGVGGLSTRYGGSGGGGGGGAVRIDATVRVEVASGGVVLADGAPGGRCQNTGASGGGGAGAGGAIWLSAPTVVNDGEVRAIGQPNCFLNGATMNDGRGGVGRIRVDTASGTAPTGTFDPAIGFAGVR